jgi:hypothetical protein
MQISATSQLAVMVRHRGRPMRAWSVALVGLTLLDAGFMDRLTFLAYEKNGAPLDSTEGPFRLIAVGEKRPARWVRGVVRISLHPLSP